LAKLAETHEIPLLIHTETSSPDYMRGLCQHYPKTRVLWAHAGALLKPAVVADIMADCPNVWIELSARDPWRFVNTPITDDNRRLLPARRHLIENYPDRVMVGSDPVWPVDVLDRWDEPDSGWEQYPRFIGFHRDWIRQVPAGLAQKMLLDNARDFFQQ
jgi:predicted TIM-barrel fold metal-dependent hydrolase